MKWKVGQSVTMIESKKENAIQQDQQELEVVSLTIPDR
jgi:hypothetical protein